MTKAQILAQLRRIHCHMEVETVDHDKLARHGASYQARKQAEEDCAARNADTNMRRDALAFAIDFIRSHMPEA